MGKITKMGEFRLLDLFFKKLMFSTDNNAYGSTE